MTIAAARATADRLEALRKLTPYGVEKGPEDLRGQGQSGLEVF